MGEKKRIHYVLILVLMACAMLTFRPGLWLVHKPAAADNAAYAGGWADGCVSGTNSYSLLYAPLLDRPFVKVAEEAPDNNPAATASHAGKTVDKTNYKTGWNEGFTLCRYYQSSVYELMQFAILITTLLYIGYQLSKRRA